MIDIFYNSKTKYFLNEYGSFSDRVFNNMNSTVFNRTSITTDLASTQESTCTAINNYIADCMASYG